MVKLSERICTPELAYVRETVAAVEKGVAPERPWDMALVDEFFGKAVTVVERMADVGENRKNGRTGVVVGLVKTGPNCFAEFREVGDDKNVKPGAPFPLDREAVAKHAFMAMAKAAAVIQQPGAIGSRQLTESGGLRISETKDAGGVPGGAIVLGRYIVVVSGYATIEEDEAAGMAIAAGVQKLVAEGSVDEVAARLGNELWVDLKPRLA